MREKRARIDWHRNRPGRGRFHPIKKPSEQAQGKTGALVQLLLDVAGASNEAATIADAFQYSLDRLVNYLGWPLGHALLAEGDDNLVPAHVWSSAATGAFAEFRAASEALRFHSGFGLVGLVLESGQPLWINDLAGDPDFRRGPAAARAGLQTALALPVMVGKTAVGVLEFFSDQRIPPDAGLMEMLGHIGVQLGRVVERKRSEAELNEIKHRLLDSIDNERIELARQIHDGPLQDLYGAFYQIEEMAGRQAPPLDEDEQAIVENVLSIIEQVNTMLRTVVSDLHPNTLVHLGLSRAIQSHAEQLQERHAEVEIHLDLDDSGPWLPEPVRLGLFRVYQQLISNAVRHAAARHIWVRLRAMPDQVILEVQDNGKGFTVPQRWIDLVRLGKVGLANVQERVERLNGKMGIHSSLAAGTTIRVLVPRKPAPPR